VIISKEKHIFVMDKENIPAARVNLPCRLTFETLDCFSEQIKTVDDTLECINFEQVNPATGPVYFEQVQPGDVLAIDINDIRVKSPGKMVAAPGAGVLGNLIEKSETLILPIENEKIQFKDLQLPLKPMIGVIGVAPAGEPLPCGVPNNHGGNMDTKLITAGTTLFLPVQVEGALLAIGDLHALMGDGEIMVSGVEVSGEVDVSVRKAEGLKINNPLLKTDQELIFFASAATLDEAVEMATKDMANFLTEKTDLSLNEAGMLMSACGNAQISQVVDPLKTARFSMPLEILSKLGVKLDF